MQVACDISQIMRHTRFLCNTMYKTQTPIHTRNSHRCSIPTGARFPQVLNSPKLYIWGWGGLGGWGLGAPGPHGPSGGPDGATALRPSKEAFGDAAQSSRRTTSPRFFQVIQRGGHSTKYPEARTRSHTPHIVLNRSQTQSPPRPRSSIQLEVWKKLTEQDAR